MAPPQAPSPSQGSGEPATEGPRCDEETRRQHNCLNLKEYLVEYFRSRFDLPLDSFYNAFVLEDINHFNLLGNGTLEEVELTEERIRDIGNTQCNRIIQRYRPRESSSGNCSWTYTCSYNPNRLPRFTVEAELSNPNMYQRVCEEVRMEGVTHFLKVPCGDPCGRSTWTISTRNSIRVGYVQQHQE